MAMPWATLCRPPMAMAMAWTAPSNPLAKARPAIREALAMSRRASRSAPWATALRSDRPMRRMASRARGSVSGWAFTET